MMNPMSTAKGISSGSMEGSLTASIQNTVSTGTPSFSDARR